MKQKMEFGTQNKIKEQIKYLEKEIEILTNARKYFKEAVKGLKKELNSFNNENTEKGRTNNG